MSKKPEELENVGDTHYEIVGYDIDQVTVISAPLDMEQAFEMAIDQWSWPPEDITVIRKVRVEEVFFPNTKVRK